MEVHIIYIEGNSPIHELCLNSIIDVSKVDIIVPHIGETFLDKIRGVEYEVKDVVRSLEAHREYGIQVMLKRREKAKYVLK